MEKQQVSNIEVLREQLEILRNKSKQDGLSVRDSIDLAHEISNIIYEIRKEDG